MKKVLLKFQQDFFVFWTVNEFLQLDTYGLTWGMHRSVHQLFDGDLILAGHKYQKVFLRVLMIRYLFVTSL